MSIAPFVLLLALALSACQSVPDSPSPVPAAPAWSDGWQPFALPGKRPTRYTVESSQGRWVVHAQADTSAGMFRRQLRVEPDQLGSLSFAWKVAALVPGGDVRDSDVEDAPVRLLLAFDGDHARLNQRTRMMFDLMHGLTGEMPPYATLMYVWDAKAPVDSLVVNRRSDRVRKIVVESGPQHIGQWRSYRRDIVADYRRAFGAEPGALISVALMTDTDNTRTRASAWYGEPRLLPRPQP
jgi:hypothetical protein